MQDMRVEVKARQTFFDLAAQYAGDAAAAYDIALAAGCSITDIPPSQVEIAEVRNSSVTAYFEEEGIVPATQMPDEDIYSQLL